MQMQVDWMNAVKIKIKIVAGNICQILMVFGGFGKRGVDGKILSINYAKNNQKFFRNLFGMQLAVIEAIRSVKGLKNLHLNLVKEIIM